MVIDRTTFYNFTNSLSILEGIKQNFLQQNVLNSRALKHGQET